MPQRLAIPPPTPSEVRYYDAIAVLLDGVCGRNLLDIGTATGLGRRIVRAWLAGTYTVNHSYVADQLGRYVWNRMNRHVLLSEADRA